ncbi:MAG TPA: SCE4755 family polysaccharide monooxygenase-like protein [Polyangiaceae bacterium]|nr:SCE4755 family polysaccharide monooxygenase-like protein [Polyangiaceae bacterium]
MSRLIVGGVALRRASEVFAALAVTFAPALASAHFTLQSPPNWTKEDGQGSPQKDWPCGNEPNTSGMDPTATGPTTAFKPGDKITIQLAETVTHGGHYRVAIATSGNMMDLPQDMSTTASGANCQNDDMQATPTFPILADGMLQHAQNQPLNGVQSFDVTLPSDISCDKCVLQVREYMTPHSNEPETASGTAAGMNGCYYHHCAFISVGSGTSGSGGMSGGGGAASGGAPSSGGAPAEGGMAGTGPTSSMGGAMGQAGTLTGSAGAPGSGGASSGGHTGSAGAPGTGGTTSTGGSTAMTGTGGAPSGGRASGTGGGSGSGIGLTTGAGTSTSGSEPASSDEKGGCNVSHPSRGSWPLSAAGVFALAFFAARRRRR